MSSWDRRRNAWNLRLLPPRKLPPSTSPTGLMNFHSFKESITHRPLYGEEDEHSILIMIDGDRFKAVNDNYGHIVGMKSMFVRPDDHRTYPDHDLASRLHGDEFCQVSVPRPAIIPAKRIMEDINSTTPSRPGTKPVITMSVAPSLPDARTIIPLCPRLRMMPYIKRKKATMADLQAHKQSSIKLIVYKCWRCRKIRMYQIDIKS